MAATACAPLRSLAQGHGGLVPGTMSLHGSTTVPFAFAGNHVYVKALIAGTPYAFLFDTGGSGIITPAVQGALKFPVIGQARVIGVGDAPEEADIVTVTEARIGDAVYRGGPFLVLPLRFATSSPLAGLRFGGIVGREFFAWNVVVVDYASSRLTLAEPAAFAADPAASAVPLTMESDHPTVRVTVNGHAGSFQIDTGGRGGVTLTKAFAESSGLAHELTPQIREITGRGVGGSLRGSAARAASVKLGAIELRDALVTVADARAGVFASPNLGGTIGAEVLRRFRVTLDVPGGTLSLRPNGAIGAPFVFNRAGLFTEREGDRETVALVVPSGPAARAGVIPGDALVTIDGVRTARVDHDALYGVWVRPAGTKLALELQRNGKPVTASVVLRDLL